MEKNNGCFHQITFVDQDGNQKTSTVPVVQELARQGLTHLPERFIWPQFNKNPLVEEYSDSNSNYSPKALPLINVARLRGNSSEPEGRAQELAKLASGVRDWGLFLIEEHGMRSCVLQGVKDVVKAFFGLSFEEKKMAVGSYGDIDNMGYGKNYVKSDDQLLDWIDRLAMKAAPAGGDEGLNVWPQTPANFRKVMEIYVMEARNTLDELLQALAEASSLERNAFAKYFDPIHSEINVRVNCYPPCPRPDLSVGITPHTDGSALTLLMQFEATGGLQVLRDHHKWVTLPWPTDVLLVTVGDLLEVMSNGRLKSPWHRVVTQKEVERFSVALFYIPPSTAEIEPEPVQDSAEEDVGGFRKVVVGDYVKHYYKVSPTEEKQAIMYARV